MQLKVKNYRNPALLRLAARARRCMNPWCEFGPHYEPGSIVGAHSNLQRHGKGTGLKAHDIVAFLCPKCHDLMDGRAKGWDRQTQESIFLESVYQTMLWLFSEGFINLNPSPSYQERK